MEVHLKAGVTDPEGDNVRKALALLGFRGVRSVRSAKLFTIEVAGADEGEALASAEEMCRKLLANPVIHDYTIEGEAGGGRAPRRPSRRRTSK